MKKLFTILAAILLTVTVFAQPPEKMSYQAVIRNSSDALVANTQVGMQISILQGSVSGTVVYTETQTPTTNANGLVSIQIGGGTLFSTIDWVNGIYFIKIETDPNGGTNYSISGTSQLTSVPYALYAKTAETVIGSITETDPVFTNWDKDYADLINIPTIITTAQADAIVDNTAKIGISAQQASDIALNNAKIGYSDDLVAASPAVASNTAKVGITVQQANDISTNNAKVGYAEALVSANADVVVNTAKVGYTDDLVAASPSVAANTAKVGITVQQTSDISTNNAKVGYTEALVSANVDVVANTAKVGVTPGTTPGQMQYWNGTAWVIVPAGNEGQVLTFVSGVPTWLTTIGTTDVLNPTTGKVWMDRNLGATQVATSSTDAAAYGDLYQWGRGTDGHQIRTSATTSTLSNTDVPGHGNFIIVPYSSSEWRSPKNDNLWQGVSGINNPCPTNYRIPTEAELDAERLSWVSQDAAGAFASPLKLPLAGTREGNGGTLGSVGSVGYYWSSNVVGDVSPILGFFSGSTFMGTSGHVGGLSVRCIKE